MSEDLRRTAKERSDVFVLAEVTVLRLRACVLLVLGLVGCTPDFDEIWLVKDLRVLAVRATPPEQIFTSVPTRVVPIEVEALVADPRDTTRVVEWEAWGCSPEENSCVDAGYSEQLVEPTTTPLDQVRLDFVPSLALVEESLNRDRFRGFGGLPILIEFRIRANNSGESTIYAIKRLVYTFPLPYSPVPVGKIANSNPSVESIDVGQGKTVEGASSPVDEPIEVVGGTELALLPKPTSEAKETYVVVTADAEALLEDPTTPTGTDEVEEFLSYNFFVTLGDLSNAATGGRPSPFVDNKKVDEVSSTWSVPNVDATATVWIVINDGRGGVDWRSFLVKISQDPSKPAGGSDDE